MKPIDFSIYDKKTDRVSHTISFRVVCHTGKQIDCPRLRLTAKWQCASCDRDYPVVLQRTAQEKEKNTYEGSVTIEAQWIFFDVFPAPQEPVFLRLAYCDVKDGWICSPPLWELSGSFFENKPDSSGRGVSFFQKILYVVCTVLLPLWLFHGILALKGHAKFHPDARGKSGKKAVFFHAQGLVKQWTGYGYSVREFKTNYMKRCYEKACRKIVSPSGILLLSERRVEAGGNMDLVRQKLQENGQPFCEFFTTKQVHKLSFRELRLCGERIAAARLVVLEDFFPPLHALAIRPETKILQLWHACGAFKLFGLSDLGIVPHLEQSTTNHRNYSAAIVSSDGMIPFYSEAFGISEKCIRPVGVPRTDIFFQEDYRTQVRKRLLEKYPVCRDKTVVLFAPTFRGSGNKTAYYPQEFFPLPEIMQVLSEDTVLLIKHHPFVQQELSTDFAGGERVLDLTHEESANDLLMFADLLITDYSSIIFEAVLLKLPILFYVFDLQEYLLTRDLYFDFSAFAPGEIVRDLEQLKKILSHGDFAKIWQEKAQESERFAEFFMGALDGKSTERTYELICEMKGTD